MEWITSPGSWAALVTLTLLEIVLGVDNIVMISILSDRLPQERRPLARKLGLAVAMVARLALLFSLTWLMGLTRPLFQVLNQELSGQDLILLAGGVFLLFKATLEIHRELEEGGHGGREVAGVRATLAAVLLQIVLLDLVFSLDSVITAVGMAREIAVMAIAIVVAVGVMIVLIDPISRFIRRHPTVKMLALSFLLLIGVMLVAEAFEQHLPKGYIYFAFGFSGFVEILNLRLREKRDEKAGEKAVHTTGDGSGHAAEAP